MCGLTPWREGDLLSSLSVPTHHSSPLALPSPCSIHSQQESWCVPAMYYNEGKAAFQEFVVFTPNSILAVFPILYTEAIIRPSYCFPHPLSSPSTPKHIFKMRRETKGNRLQEFWKQRKREIARLPVVTTPFYFCFFFFLVLL